MSDARMAMALFAAAFLIRLVAWMGAAIFGTDGCHYLLMADWMREGRFSDALAIGYHPFYPFLTAVLSVPFGRTADVGGLVSVMLGAATVFPLFHLARATFGRAEAFVAALLYAFNPSIIEPQSDVMTEGTFLFFFVGSIWLAWRQLEAPTLSGAATLGASSAAAFLTRPEGILVVALSVGWPLAVSLVRRKRLGMLVCGALLTAAVAGVTVFPYLAWIRNFKGHWDLSMRPSVDSALTAVGLIGDGTSEDGSAPAPVLLRLGKAVYRLTYLVTIPFYVLGFASLRRRDAWGALFLLSFPVGYFGGLLVSLKVHSFMSQRYVIPAMTVLMIIAAKGFTEALRRLAERYPGDRRLPLAGAAALLAVAVLPAIRHLGPVRWDCRSYRDAAQWIRTQGQPRAVSGPVQQVAYLTGCRSYYGPRSAEEVARQIAAYQIDYYVYSDKDLERRPEYVAMLRSCPALGAPHEIVGPPGTLKVYVQKTR